MTSTIELSYYPLRQDYPQAVLVFLDKLKTLSNVEIHTNGMSTILIGDYQELWNTLGSLIASELHGDASVFVMKVAPGRREFVE